MEDRGRTPSVKDTGKISGRLKDADPSTISSLVSQEMWRIRKQRGVTHKIAYWEACENVGKMFTPPISAQEVSKYKQSWATSHKSQEPATSSKPDGELGGGWVLERDIELERTEQFDRYISDLPSGRTASKKFSTKKEADSWRSSFISWTNGNKRWRNQGGGPLFKTNVRKDDKQWKLLITKLP